ncbi:hypothetical protein DL96DRAFT_1465374 [Flagelloscypha sp. PMI_526]|nr:hypothetical protein DL96DRAFT_1465374 [Flagelloscypha sp. PMI_526]
MLPVSLASLLLWLGLCIPLGIFVPFYGAFVRVRAHYQPKGIQLSSEDGTTTTWSGYSFIAMLKRTHRIEGWQGLLKGHVPVALHVLVYCLYASLFFSQDNIEKDTIVRIVYKPDGWIQALLMQAGLSVLTLPFHVLQIRAVVTPYVLNYWNLRRGLRILLSGDERRRPWLLYFIPGIFLTLVLSTLGSLLRTSFFLVFLRTISTPSQFSIITIIFSVFAWCTFTVMLVPLEVIFVRLAIQRHQGQQTSYEYVIPGVEEFDDDGEEPPTYAQGSDDVVELRTELQPYNSFIDCVKSMYWEEGWRVFTRAAWATILTGLSHIIIP